MKQGREKGLKKSRTGAFDIINMLILLLIAVLCVCPFLYIFFIASSDGTYLTRGQVTFFPKGFQLESFRYVLTNPRFDVFTGMKNSFIYTAAGTAVAVVFTYMTAYAITRPRLKQRYFIMTLFVITWVFEAGIIPQYIVYSNLGFIDNIWVMIIPGAINTQYLIITKAFLEGLPKELEEAAFVDGATDFKTMLHVYVPISKSIIATIALFNAEENDSAGIKKRYHWSAGKPVFQYDCERCDIKSGEFKSCSNRYCYAAHSLCLSVCTEIF